MEEYRYLFTDSVYLKFPQGVIYVEEAKAIECFEHAIKCNAKNKRQFIEEFTRGYVGEEFRAEEVKDWGEIYLKIREHRFIGFFGDGKSTGDNTPFYSTLAHIADVFSGDPYDVLEKRTRRQVSNLLKGKGWNSRVGVKFKKEDGSMYDGDRENQKMLLKETTPDVDKFDMLDDIIKNQKNPFTK